MAAGLYEAAAKVERASPAPTKDVGWGLVLHQDFAGLGITRGRIALELYSCSPAEVEAAMATLRKVARSWLT